MARPDIEDYKKRINGSKGMAFKRLMDYTGVQALLDYIDELEKR